MSWLLLGQEQCCTADEDGDGFICDEDCDDLDAEVYPGADEQCDGKDNDCDGLIDEESDCQSCGEILEDFEAGEWPVAPWISAGGIVAPEFAHDGDYGYHGLAEWSFRTDVDVGVNGDLLSIWVRIDEGDPGRFYLGFDADASGALSLVVAPNSDELLFQDNTGYGFADVLSTPFIYPTEAYYLELEFQGEGIVEGRLYSDDGVTLQTSLVHDFETDLLGGVAIRSVSDVYGDTLGLCTEKDPAP